MLLLLCIINFLAGITIHAIALHFPRHLYRTWNRECLAYLEQTHRKIDIRLELPRKLLTKNSWRVYLPFFSSRFLIWDGLLYLSLWPLIHYYSHDPLILISILLFTWLLLCSCCIDAEYQILPDEISYILLWLGLALSCKDTFISSSHAILSAMIAYFSLSCVALLFKVIRKKEGLGQGDIKLFSALAAWTGLSTLPYMVLIASLTSLFFIFLRKLYAGERLSSAIAFGPFLALGAWLVLMWGDSIRIFFMGQS